MKRRVALMVVGLLAAGSLQVTVAPAASASETCADPHCPWSPVTYPVRLLCRDALPELCPL
ncbi:MAG TPA: hypothetical protein VNP73_06300 [Actinomycetota bacterium]|nr:hypothetical protein [Actinomycetota bacterium]